MRRTTDPDSSHAPAPSWWHNAVFYRISPRSFSDSSGNGVGDLDGIRERIGYLELLGIDAIWLTPVLRDPPDGSGPIPDVDPMIGDVQALEWLIAEAHACDIRMAIDVPVGRRHVDSPHVRDKLVETVRFWLERGVDAFRLCTSPGAASPADEAVSRVLHVVAPLVASYGDRAVGALVDGTWFHRFGDAHSLQLGIDLRFGDAGFDAFKVRDAIERMHTDASAFGMPPVWGRASRDPFRPVVRYGSGARGLARARAMLLVRLALPGVIGVDSCEELGVPDANLPGQMGEDPIRNLMPWEGNKPPFGFSEAPGNWWPINEDWAPFTVEAQLEDPDSILSLYRSALDLRQQNPAFTGDDIEWFGAPDGCFAFRRAEGNLLCALNTSSESVPVPPGEVLLASGPLTAGRLPPDTAVWLA